MSTEVQAEIDRINANIAAAYSAAEARGADISGDQNSENLANLIDAAADGAVAKYIDELPTWEGGSY